MKLEKLQNNLTSSEVEQKAKEIELRKTEDNKTNQKIVSVLSKLIELKDKMVKIEEKIHNEAVGIEEYKKFTEELNQTKNLLLATNSQISRFFGDKVNHIYSFDEIDEKIKNLEEKQKETEKEEKIANQN